MTELEYQVSFATPTFLGNAEQQAQWRTPPFKALIRQWWRVVKAKDFGYDHRRLREAEMHLFGAAGAEGKNFGRSKLRLRLSSWDMGTLPSVRNGESVAHQEVPGGQVGANLYLGYGPIGGGVPRSAIKPGEAGNTLHVRCPDEHAVEIRAAMQLAAWFGTLGSRSRNGWGAIHIEGEETGGFAALNIPGLTGLIAPRPLAECLRVEWTHALGCDAGGTPLVWRLLKLDKEKKQLVSFGEWEEVMRELARIKIAIRTSAFFKFNGGGGDGHPNPQPRHILAYPSGGRHKVDAKTWGQNGRLANQVLFKVHRRGNGFAATIAHFPSGLPAHMATGLQLPDQAAVWAEVHRLLDAEKGNGLSRIKGAQA